MKTNLSKIQLNLLLALDALLTECHVTRAGEKLFISQAAMSNLLKQLRHILKDELLVRGAASSMTLTPRAQALKIPVKEALEKAALVFMPLKAFDPASEKRTFTLGMSDYAELILLPSIIQAVTRVAPNIDIIVRHLNFIDDSQRIALENDTLDLAVGICLEAPSPLVAEALFKDRVVCLGDKNNPLLKKPLTLKEYANAQHLLIVFNENKKDTYSEQLLLQKGYARRAVVTMPHTLVATHVLQGTQLVTTILERVINKLDMANKGLCFQPVPFRYPKPVVSQVWHPKNNNDQGHTWLRSVIRKAVEAE
jgi:DNA-binding transcriptional LysR family regulator